VRYYPERLGILFVPLRPKDVDPRSRCTKLWFNLVSKRRKNLLYLGAAHAADVPELFGITGDHLAVDAISMSPPSVYIPPTADGNSVS